VLISEEERRRTSYTVCRELSKNDALSTLPMRGVKMEVSYYTPHVV